MRKILIPGIALLLLLPLLLQAVPASERKHKQDIPKTPQLRHIWQLNFHTGFKVGDADPFDPDDTRKWKHVLPERIVIKQETGEPEAYWYLLYTIQNHDKDEFDTHGLVRWTGEHTIFINVSACSDKSNTSTFGVAEAVGGQEATKDSAIYNDLTNPEVKKAVEKLLINEIKAGTDKKLWAWKDLCMPETPGKKKEMKTDEINEGINLPTIKSGETRRCIAIFDKLDCEAKALKIYFQGLTNDITAKTHLDDPSINEFERLITERLMELVYERMGDEFFAIDDPIKFVKRTWIKWTKKIRVDLKHSPEYPGAND